MSGYISNFWFSGILLYHYPTTVFIKGEGARGAPPPPDDLRFSNTTGILQKKTMWFIGVEVEQETSAPPPKKNPGSAPDLPLSAVTEVIKTTTKSLTL